MKEVEMCNENSNWPEEDYWEIKYAQTKARKKHLERRCWQRNNRTSRSSLWDLLSVFMDEVTLLDGIYP